MDAYSSLLNLNFMASLRTGNIITDMLIAMLIPFVSGMVARFFSEWWPNYLRSFLEFFVSSIEAVTVVTANREMRNSHSLDLDENLVLQEALMQYIGKQITPVYPYGSYQFKRLAAKGSSSDSGGLSDVLTNFYSVHTVPSKEEPVELAPNMTLRIAENDDDVDDNNEQNDDNKNNNDRDGNDKKSKKPKKSTMHFKTLQRSLRGRDQIYDFACNAFQWYTNEIKQALDRERYLYQPLVQGKISPLEDSSDEPPVMSCQRYTLSMEKTFRTLFFPQKGALIELIDQFESKSGKFSIPGFPHKLVLLLYGPPGTGKTSLVKAIAAYTSRHILSIPLSRVQSNRELISYMYDGRCKVVNQSNNDYYGNDKIEKLRSDNVVYMLEDVDAASDIVLNKVRTGTGNANDGPSLSPSPAPETSAPAKEDDASSDRKEAEEAQQVQPDEDSASTANASEAEVREESSAAAPASPSQENTTSEPAVEKVAITQRPKTILGGVDDSLSIKGVLEALGGILDAPGRIVIMTTNHLDHLDAALVRPGVVTMKLHMGTFNPDCAMEMVRHYFSPIASSSKPALDAIYSLINESQKSKKGGFSPAEVEQMCAENDTVEDLLAALKRGSQTDVF